MYNNNKTNGNITSQFLLQREWSAVEVAVGKGKVKFYLDAIFINQTNQKKKNKKGFFFTSVLVFYI